MNKNIKEYFTNKGLIIEKDKGYGIIEGYETNLISQAYGQNPVLLHISTYVLDETKGKIIAEINNMNVKMLNVFFTEYGLAVSITDMTIKKLLNRLDKILDSIYAILKDYGALQKEYCPLCGNILSENSKTYNIDGLSMVLDTDCVEKINEAIEQDNKNFENAPNNYLKGFAGTIIGSIVGAISFVVLYLMGFISGISAFISVLLGTHLYKKFGGKPNKVMILLTVVSTIVVLLLTVFVLYVVMANGLVQENGFTSNGIKAFNDMMTIETFKKSFINDMIMTIIFTLIGIVYDVIDLNKSVKRMDKIK